LMLFHRLFSSPRSRQPRCERSPRPLGVGEEADARRKPEVVTGRETERSPGRRRSGSLGARSRWKRPPASVTRRGRVEAGGRGNPDSGGGRKRAVAACRDGGRSGVTWSGTATMRAERASVPGGRRLSISVCRGSGPDRSSRRPERRRDLDAAFRRGGRTVVPGASRWRVHPPRSSGRDLRVAPGRAAQRGEGEPNPMGVSG
jgi:hypothetical protein